MRDVGEVLARYADAIRLVEKARGDGNGTGGVRPLRRDDGERAGLALDPNGNAGYGGDGGDGLLVLP